MSKAKSTPGFHETTLEGLKADWVALAQRCTQMETRLQQGIDENGRCLTVVVVMAIAALGLGIANAVVCIMEVWS